MKKIFALIAMAMMVLSLSGCIDSQDDSGGKLPSKDIPTK
jgi:hypothetical protein